MDGDDLKKVAYYPGCALEGTGHAYNRSTKEVGKALGLDLVELKNWNCCGAMEVKNVDPQVQTYLSARNLAITEEMGFDKVMAPCNGCYHNLKKAEYDLAHNPHAAEVNDRISRKAGHATYQPGGVETIHALDWIKRAVGEDQLKAKAQDRLKGLKVANYYGCMYTRPRHIFPEKDKGPGSESTLKPHFMDDILAAAGAENVDFPLKTACCGGAHSLYDSDMSTKLLLNILQTAEACGAEVIATECPPPADEVKAALLQGFATHLGITPTSGPILASEEDAAARIFDEEIGQDEFVYGIDDPAHQAEVLSGSHASPGGTISAHLRLERGQLREIVFTGDFFVTPPRTIADLEASLRGVEVKQIRSAIESFFASTQTGLLSAGHGDFADAVDVAIRSLQTNH